MLNTETSPRNNGQEGQLPPKNCPVTTVNQVLDVTVILHSMVTITFIIYPLNLKLSEPTRACCSPDPVDIWLYSYKFTAS